MRDNIIEGRLIDIPYRTSPPILFVYSETASLAAGAYNWVNGVKSTFTPSRPITANSLYVFHTMDFACDIDPADYQGAISSQLNFSMYLQSDASSPALREPIPLVKYFNTLPYTLSILGTELLGEAYQNSSGITPAQGFSFNRLIGDISGSLVQTPSLLGKTSITATLVFSVQEISDRNFIQDFINRSEAGQTGNRRQGGWA
jgi:hypothetical protein